MASLGGKLTLLQLSPKANFNLLSTETTIAPINTNSTFNVVNRMNSLQINPTNKNDSSFKRSYTNLNIENNINFLPNFNYTSNKINNNDNDEKVIKSRHKNQSQLSVSLNFLRGKSLKHIDFRSSFIEGNNKSKFDKNKNNNTNKKNLSSTAVNLNKITQNPFAKFFKKPLSFRVNEFEEIHQLERDEENKQNKAYAQQRFFGNTVSETNVGFSAQSKNTINDSNPQINSPNNNNYNKKKNPNLDDIEKVMLVNNEEELVKKYILPRMKNLNAEERKKLVKYDIHDKTERFVINKGQPMFLADILKDEVDSKGNLKAGKSPEKHYDPRKIEINVSDTKYGMYPKFLMRTSSFVRYVDYGKNNINNIENEENKEHAFSKTFVPKKLNFNNDFNVNNTNSNNNYYEKIDGNNVINTEESLNFAGNSMKQIRNSSLSIKNNIYNENLNNYNNYYNLNANNDPQTNTNSKKSVTGLINNISNLHSNKNINYKINNDNNQNSPTAIQQARSSNFAYLNKNKISSESITKNNFQTTTDFNINNSSNNNKNKNITENCFTNSQGYMKSPNSNWLSPSQNTNKYIILDYPQVKFPLQPYKRLNHKAKEDKNYLTNGSMVHNPEVIKKVKDVNVQVSSNFQNEKEVYISNEMSQNIDKLNVIEKKINKLIFNSKEGMKESKEYRRFNSNSSVLINK